MNIAIQCIILLSCTTICISKPILKCRCAETSAAVNPWLIHDVKQYEPCQYCKNKEVIVELKDKRLCCLDPNGIFAQTVLPIILKQLAHRANKKKTTNLKTTNL